MLDSQNLTPPLSPAQMRDTGERIRRIMRQLAAGITRLEVVLGADAVYARDLSGVHHLLRRRRTSREMCEYFLSLLFQRDFQPAELLLGIEIEFEGRPVLVRMASVEEEAYGHARNLRDSGGQILRRAEADRIADLLMLLADRSRSPLRAGVQ